MNDVVRPVLAGNWKMHKGPGATRDFFRDFTRRVDASAGRTLMVFPPSLSLTAAAAGLQNRPDVRLGVQNIHWEADGAFTGEVSAGMAREAGASAVLVGHSERRHIFGETSQEVGRKVLAALAEGLIPLVCVGETLDERRAGRVELVIADQLTQALHDVREPPPEGLIIAYEPVWAIGTGVHATPADAAAAHRVLRERLAARFGTAAADIPILYGGSVKPDNAGELLAASDVDGLLVGGASLNAESFAAIVAAAS
jgi:triosephosphate isomerase (TIM)